MHWFLAGLWASVPVIFAIAATTALLSDSSAMFLLMLGVAVGAVLFTWHAHGVIEGEASGASPYVMPKVSRDGAEGSSVTTHIM
jgi:hypothetical protein